MSISLHPYLWYMQSKTIPWRGIECVKMSPWLTEAEWPYMRQWKNHNWFSHYLSHYLNQCWNSVKWTNFNDILIEIHIFSLKKIHLKMSSEKWRSFCLGLNVLMLKNVHGLKPQWKRRMANVYQTTHTVSHIKDTSRRMDEYKCVKSKMWWWPHICCNRSWGNDRFLCSWLRKFLQMTTFTFQCCTSQHYSC